MSREIVLRRGRMGPQYWQGQIQAQRTSGLTQAAFCAREGLAYSTFTRWKRRLGHSSEQPHQAAFVELLAPEPTTSSTSWDLELDLGRALRLRWRRR